MTVVGIIHSEESKGKQEFTVERKGNNKYIATLPNGSKCTAIYNCFNGLYYADDIYGKIES